MQTRITIEQLKKMGFNVVELKQPVALIAGRPMTARTTQFDTLEKFMSEFSEEWRCGFPLHVYEPDTSRPKNIFEGYGDLEENGYFLRMFYFKE